MLEQMSSSKIDLLWKRKESREDFMFIVYHQAMMMNSAEENRFFKDEKIWLLNLKPSGSKK